jgi:DNA-binding PadR family transcriptional regulator
MIADIDTQFGIRLGPGTLYGSISKLAERGLLRALPAADRRRPYEITPAGRLALETYLESWSTVVEVGTRRLANS